jgi:DNA-binding winged helix-turn-helix (wHTH) protein
MLLREAGRVVTKDELARTLWPDQFVTDNSLTKAVSDLRRILKRYSGEEYIRTVSPIGYQFTGERTAPGTSVRKCSREPVNGVLNSV